jgi:DNA-binding IclR family transcriptional regulator
MWQGGQSMDLELSVIGSIFFYPEEQLEQLQEEDSFLSELENHGRRIFLDRVKDRVKEMIKKALESDLQDDFALFYPGVRRFAVPIREKGKVVMVLGLGILDARVASQRDLEEIFLRLKQFQHETEELLNNFY